MKYAYQSMGDAINVMNLFHRFSNNKTIMNLNIYKKHKSFFLQAHQKEKPPAKAYSHALAVHRANELLAEAKMYYHSQTHLQEAVIAFQKFLELQPNHDEALYLCGVCEVQLQRFESAILKFESISQAYSLQQNALLLASIASNKLGQVSRSLGFVNECLQKSPRYEEALCFRGKLNLQTNNYLKAELDFKNVVSINPNSYLGFIGLADCCKLAYKYESAIEFYRKSLAILEDSKDSEKLNTKEIYLKMGICFYFLEKYSECHEIFSDLSLNKEMKTSQLFYYLGLTEIQLQNRQKGLNHLQYAIRLETNTFIMEKAFKKLVLLYLANHQFYEAQSISKLSDVYAIRVKEWKELIDCFMLVIKNKHEQGLQGITRIYQIIRADKQSARRLKINDKDKKIDDFIFKSEHLSNLIKRKNFILKSDPRIKSHKKSFQRSTDKQRRYPLLPIKRSIEKVQSLRLNTNNYQSFPLKLGRFKTEYQQAESQTRPLPFAQKEKQVIFPILMRFKAYCEFFTDKIKLCCESFQEYEVYIQDLLGKDSDVKYSRSLCDILLIVDSEELDEALLKCNQAINIHLENYGSDSVLVLLYKVAILIRMAIVGILNDQEHKQESYEILILTLEMVEQKDVLNSHPLTHYFKGIIYILVDDYKNAQESLATANLLTDIGISSMLFMKGLVQIRRGNYLVAFKDITGSIMAKKTDRAYLARAIILYNLSEQQQILKEEVSNLILQSLDDETSLKEIVKNGNLGLIRECIVEKCLDDIQNYVDLSQNDDEIPLWVTKLLFACRSYDEVISSIQKVTVQSAEMNRISDCLSIYNGEFSKGGKAGLKIKAALDGVYLSAQEQQSLLLQPSLEIFSSRKKQLDYLSGAYEMWLILLHLYMKQEYQMCIRVIERLIPECKEKEEGLLLKFNLAFIYFLTQQHEKAIQCMKSLYIYDGMYQIRPFVDRIIDENFVNDECIGDLTQILRFRASKMLSSYLPYQLISLSKGSERIKVFGRINVPFPFFPTPQLNLQFDINFILGELDLHKIPKSMQAPWIKRLNQSIQFTDSMQDTIVQFQGNEEEGGMALPLKTFSSKRVHQFSLD